MSVWHTSEGLCSSAGSGMFSKMRGLNSLIKSKKPTDKVKLNFKYLFTNPQKFYKFFLQNFFTNFLQNFLQIKSFDSKNQISKGVQGFCLLSS